MALAPCTREVDPVPVQAAMAGPVIEAFRDDCVGTGIGRAMQQDLLIHITGEGLAAVQSTLTLSHHLASPVEIQSCACHVPIFLHATCPS